MSEQDRKGTSPIRSYICLEQQILEGDEVCYVIAGTVQARNSTNAMRKAYREFVGAKEHESVMVVIPEGAWRPLAVRGTRRPDITVSIG